MRTSLAALVALALLAGEAGAQQRLRERIVGSWDFVVAEVTAPDGRKSFPFGRGSASNYYKRARATD